MSNTVHWDLYTLSPVDARNVVWQFHKFTAQFDRLFARCFLVLDDEADVVQAGPIWSILAAFCTLREMLRDEIRCTVAKPALPNSLSTSQTRSGSKSCS